MRKNLYLKGWSEEEVKYAEKVIRKAEKKKHPHVKKLETCLYWFTLIIGIIGTLLISLILIPVLLINSTAWGYVLTGVFAFLLGALIILIVKDLEWLEHHHHLLISLLIPIIAIFNLFIVVNRINLLSHSLGLNNFHNPTLIGATYFICFILPYALFLTLKRK